MPKFTGYLCDESGEQIVPGRDAYAIVTMEYFGTDGERAEVQRRYVAASAFGTLKPGEKVNTRVRQPKDADAKGKGKSAA